MKAMPRDCPMVRFDYERHLLFEITHRLYRSECPPPLTWSPLGYLRWHLIYDIERTPRELACSLCGEPFTAREVQWTVDAPQGNQLHGVAALVLHHDCHVDVRDWMFGLGQIGGEHRAR